MARALLLTWTNPADDESESAFNTWYDETHIPQIRAAVPSIGAVHRYRTAAGSLGDAPGQAAHRYLVVYELDSDDVGAAEQEIGKGIASGQVEMSAALDLTKNPPVQQWYQGL